MNDELFHGILLLALRCIAGFLFFFQAYDKLFRIGTKEVVRQFQNSLPSIPSNFLYIVVFVSGIAELIGSLLLILGIGTSYSLSILIIDLTAVALSFSLIRPMWDMQYFFPRLALLITIALLPSEWDIFSLGSLLIN